MRHIVFIISLFGCNLACCSNNLNHSDDISACSFDEQYVCNDSLTHSLNEKKLSKYSTSKAMSYMLSGQFKDAQDGNGKLTPTPSLTHVQQINNASISPLHLSKADIVNTDDSEDTDFR